MMILPNISKNSITRFQIVAPILVGLYFVSKIVNAPDIVAIPLALSWILYVPYGIGTLMIRLPSSPMRAFSNAISNFGPYGLLIKWMAGLLVVSLISVLSSSGLVSPSWLGLILAAVSAFGIPVGSRIFGSLPARKKTIVMLIIAISLGVSAAAYIRSFSPYPLTPGLDIFTHLYVIKGIMNQSVDSPLQYIPVFDTLVALGSATFNGSLVGIFWAGSFVIGSIFAVSTYALAYTFTRNHPTAIVSTIIALLLTEQGFVPSLQSFYPSSFVMALFPLILVVARRTWSDPSISTTYKSVITSVLLSGVIILHYELAIVVILLVLCVAFWTRALSKRVLYAIRISTIVMSAVLMLYYYSYMTSQIELNFADGQYAYGVAQKVKLLNEWYTGKIVFAALVGLGATALFRNRYITFLGFAGSILLLLYFQKIDLIHRYLALERPLLSIAAGIVLVLPFSILIQNLSGRIMLKQSVKSFASALKIEKIPTFEVRERFPISAVVYALLVVILLFPTLMQPYDIYVSAYSDKSLPFANFTNEELEAGTWIEHNTPKNHTIFSDPFTVVEMRGLGYRKNIEAISWNHTVADIVKAALTAKSPEEARAIISSQFGDNNIIIITPRTSVWLNGTDYLVQFPQFDFVPFHGFENFMDQKYFTMIYHSQNIFVFLPNKA